MKSNFVTRIIKLNVDCLPTLELILNFLNIQILSNALALVVLTNFTKIAI
jgi:hypothetical protein